MIDGDEQWMATRHRVGPSQHSSYQTSSVDGTTYCIANT